MPYLIILSVQKSTQFKTFVPWIISSKTSSKSHFGNPKEKQKKHFNIKAEIIHNHVLVRVTLKPTLKLFL